MSKPDSFDFLIDSAMNAKLETTSGGGIKSLNSRGMQPESRAVPEVDAPIDRDNKKK